MDRLIAPHMQRTRKSPHFSKSGMIIPSPEMRTKSKKVGKTGLGSRFYPLKRTDSSWSSRVDWQTRLVEATPVDLGGLFAQGWLRWTPN
ncbi:hypothetical protein CRG98_012063 [Punica granatum]|uniref:Uncharacterized protein n=1 Tax=Punica granatum TaxID=22663 RepID=A0A2I0KG53_PUNGR|nr:hypothetical protein CRG98_012063 [Punica granatum]